jgi:hypothetical protein
MTDDDPLRDLLRAVYPPTTGRDRSRDLWTSVVARIDTPVRPPRLDVALAMLIAALLIVFPEYVWLLAYHM